MRDIRYNHEWSLQRLAFYNMRGAIDNTMKRRNDSREQCIHQDRPYIRKINENPLWPSSPVIEEHLGTLL